MSFIKQHWRGRNSLLLTLLFSVLVLRLVAGFINQFVPHAIAMPWVFLSVALLVWQSVGAIRAGEQCLQVRGSVVWYWSAIVCVFVAGVLTLLQVVDLLLVNTEPVEYPVATIELLPVSRDGRSVTLEGHLDWPLRSRFIATLSSHASIDSVKLSSDGGLVYVARALALTISELGMNTSTDSRCYSACTIVFLAGTTRSLGVGGRLGFHRYAMEAPDRIHAISVADELSRDIQSFAANGVTEPFLQKIIQVSHNDLWIPERHVLVESGVLTEP